MPETKRFTGYRTGLLTKIYDILATRGGLTTTKNSFIKDCLSDPEIVALMDNGVFNKLDEMDGTVKLILTLYSKYLQHRITAT